MISTEGLGEIEFRIKRKDGRTVWLQCLIRTIEFRGRKAVLATFVDITNKEEREREKVEVV